MAKKFILILGGARSGKSKFAQSLAQKLGTKIIFVATAEPLDEEMALRIKEHKAVRPKSWRTLEIGSKVGQKIAWQIDNTEVVLLDCITLLISNLLTSLCHCGEPKPRAKRRESEAITLPTTTNAESQVMAEIEDLIKCIDKYEGSFIVVSNEVGLGLVPENRLGRVYRDLLGKANQLLAQHADEVYFMVSGIPIKIKGDRTSLAR
ncbi:MAG: bifunctional adenosylcobinamide kinase/adenosylcobinamide-phosphate guanylyltransferase [Chloroflexi bacterium CG_4_9_14_3_um_filter_45_9]|nr:MAG: bifunctional adenosylcobinamide kinase/adenosylcobinamide-phosphate guanylyltransferase [Chloroflexi bacterium CG_4_9_14_3_um_filter_45_9]